MAISPSALIKVLGGSIQCGDNDTLVFMFFHFVLIVHGSLTGFIGKRVIKKVCNKLFFALLIIDLQVVLHLVCL